MAKLDLIVRQGTIVDGTGRPSFKADIGIADGKLVAVGSITDTLVANEIDASGLIVTPGFIDIHSHSDLTLLVDPRALSALAQGVTTELVGNCGHGCFPLRDTPTFRANIYGFEPGYTLDWTTAAQYLDRLEDVSPAINVGTLVPNGNLRLATMEAPDRRSNTRERRAMIRLLEEGLDAGAFGFSSGLEYSIEGHTTESELVDLCRLVARRDALYATHVRERDVAALAGLDEAIRTAAASDVRLQVSHLLPRPGGPPDTLERMIDRISSAIRGHIDVACDVHTRLFGLTNLSAVLPPWALEGNAASIAERLGNPESRNVIQSQASRLILSFGRVGWDRVFILNAPRRPDVAGKSVAAIMSAGQDALDVILDVLLSEVDDIHRPMCICWSYEEDQIALALRAPYCSVASDATTLSPDGPLGARMFHGAYTWAAWFLRRLVRERAELTIEDAVRRITSLPAQRMGLSDRGIVQIGAHADLAVLDLGVVSEQGTVERPSQLAVGVKHVIVNGQVAIHNEAPTDIRAGHVLRR